MIAIVDYGVGNVKAISNIYENLGINAFLVQTPSDLRQATKIILPGVGAFDEAISQLNSSGMREELDTLVLKNKTPVLGICVGMQIMACGSEEGNIKGLSWFDNSWVVKLDEKTIMQKPKTPHMGWNNTEPVFEHQIFKQVDHGKGFYFLHSYKFICQPENKLAVTNYGGEFASAVCNDHIYGFQFHPEKSHQNGVNIFKNFASIN